MAEQKGHSEETINKGVAPETTDRGYGLFNFMGKKEEDKAHDETVMIDTPANVDEPKEEKHSLMEKLHRTHSNSSSSSDEEEVEEGGNGEKKRKKGLKDKIKEKMSGDHNKEYHHETTDQQKVEFIPMDNCPAPYAEPTHEEEKKGFMDKIKEKLPGHHNKTDQEVNNAPAAHSSVDEQVHGGETKDQKKGLLDKIKEKLPGHGHKNNEDEEKQKSN
ncbi:phosphoprotein ECPP44-like [Lycium barbarum]|uniref:phosphoprotein ECPP44-like n=1 Tax=Lycium barbarum TaxID=112863 RepID=UPI00293E0D05|nr:phosphoprotein ECPP44-like [Lycium barbarum]